MCAVICRKATLRFSMLISSLPGANSRFPEHKIGVFVLFWPSEPPFLGISSTKSAFLCFFGLRNPRFRAFRAQNRGFCALLAFGTPIFGTFEHKIAIFVLGEVYSGGGVLGMGYSGILPGECCSCPGSAARVWRGLFVCSDECEELFSEGCCVFEEQCVHAGGDGTLYVGWLVVCEEAL